MPSSGLLEATLDLPARAINARTAASFLAEPPLLGDAAKAEDKLTMGGFLRRTARRPRRPNY